jgi:RHS repeat-associated protein
MMGQLASAVMTNINGSTWAAGYNYTKDGNVSCQTGSNASTYSFDGDLMTAINSSTLTWDDNGRLTAGIADSFTYNLDGRLKTGGTVPTDYIDLAYDPMNNRVYKKSVVPGQGESSVTTETQYIVDIVGGLPTILCEFDLDDSSLTYSYIYAESQVLTQLEHGYDSQAEVFTLEDRLFYLHDRLGSIREVVDFDDISPVDGIEDTPVVVAGYTYNPYGQDHSSECFENTGLHNPFKYTGQWYDPEISQYYLRARMYDPQLMRFTGRDPVRGKFADPLMLHKYLYCQNNSINRVDPNGKIVSLVTFLIATTINDAFKKSDLNYKIAAGTYAVTALTTLVDIFYVIPTVVDFVVDSEFQERSDVMDPRSEDPNTPYNEINPRDADSILEDLGY